MADSENSELIYAGDVSPQEAWDILTNEEGASLVDVRTGPEWAFVGVTDLSSIDKEQINISWQVFPAMEVNPNFADEVKAACQDPDAAILFLCRSGQRSQGAAAALTAAGYKRCYNITEGFEGGLDDDKHRGSSGGWKVRSLPWIQR